MAKMQRWIDLLAALLKRNYPVPLEELKQDVPGYLKTPTVPALRRTFERDKDELRRFGVPLATIKDGAGEVVGYQLKREHFYLPYLTVLRDGRPSSPRKVKGHYGYNALRTLSFEPDELQAVSEAAMRVRRLGIAALTELAESAMRKLAFDLPTDVSLVEQPRAVHQALRTDILQPSDVAEFSGIADHFAPPPKPRLSDIFERLDLALTKRKRVTVSYTTGAGAASTRDVMPYGLFFLGHHWYLAARDSADGPVKNFRVSRIEDAKVNAAKPGEPDYVIPPTFRLPEHARSREAWELGDTAFVEAIVRFTGTSGPTVAARRLGEPIADAPECRRFQVRRIDVFSRWLLSFAGEAEPVAPPELVESHRALAERTLAVYAGTP
jgi:predicted DNA-binding transcriptional regulator YafY